MNGVPSETEDAGDPLIGRTLGGQFVIEQFVGCGAMASVYRARQIALDRPVAVKVLHRGYLADKTFAARFHREAKAASSLEHPNLIHINDYGEEPDGVLYIAMEFLPGHDLLSVLDREWPLSHARIVDLLSQTLAGLAEAHDARILHRDLKPENIMVVRRTADDGSPVDVVKVCDFGIAKMLDADEAEAKRATFARRLSTRGLVVGTPEYMSPEQARGEPLDARSDLYAVGVILYQMIAGRVPFEGMTPLSVVLKAQRDDPRPLAALGGTTAAALEPICMRAMSKRPEDRYASAREMRAALRAASPCASPRTSAALPAPRLATDDRRETRLAVSRPPRSRSLAPLAAALGALALAPPRAAPVVSETHASPLAQVALPAPTHAEPPPPSLLPSAPTMASAAIARGAEPVPVTRAAPSPRPRPRGATIEPTRRAAPVIEATSDDDEPSPPAVVTFAVPSAARSSPPALAAAPQGSPSAAVPAPPFDERTARIDVGQPRSNNAATTAMQIGRAMIPLTAGLTACYRASLSPGMQSPGEGTSTLHLETDDQGYVVLARVTGPAPLAAARCIETVALQRARITVDTGTASADVPLLVRAR